jgi:hypothetical protein
MHVLLSMDDILQRSFHIIHCTFAINGTLATSSYILQRPFHSIRTLHTSRLGMHIEGTVVVGIYDPRADPNKIPFLTNPINGNASRSYLCSVYPGVDVDSLRCPVHDRDGNTLTHEEHDLVKGQGTRKLS